MMGKLKLLITGLVIFLLFQIPTKLGGLIAARFDREHWVNKEINIPVDLWISRVIEVFISIPRLLLILAAVAISIRRWRRRHSPCYGSHWIYHMDSHSPLHAR